MANKIDPEAAAIQQLTDCLAPLDEEARSRVLDWATRRYGSAIAAAAVSSKVTETITAHRPVHVGNSHASAAPPSESAYEHFADLYDAAGPQTDAEKALVGGYWLQVCGKADSFQSRDVNELLKNQGHPVGNITRAFDALRDSRPAFVSQLEKSGKTKQARKKLKLTTTGIRKVYDMVKANGLG
jgi:hypothetical protein